MLNERDIIVLNRLFNISKSIFDEYFKTFKNRKKSKTVIFRIIELINKENKLLDLLYIDDSKYKAIRGYIMNKLNTPINDGILLSANMNMNFSNYYLYRVLARCKYRRLEATRNLSEQFETFFLDEVTEFLFKILFESKDFKDEFWQYAIFTLIDSPNTELKILDNNLTPSDEIFDSIRFGIELKCFKENLKLDAIYDAYTNSFIIPTCALLSKETRYLISKIHPTTKLMDIGLFVYLLNYFKVCEALIESNSKRGRVYMTMNEIIKDASSRRIELLQILSKSIDDIEKNLVPLVAHASLTGEIKF